MMISEKNSAGPTCLRRADQDRLRSLRPVIRRQSLRSARWRYPFSTITIAASTSTPIASAKPAQRHDVGADVAGKYIGMNAASTAIGSVRIGTSAERK